MTEQQRIALLLNKYLQGSLSETDARLLEQWKRQSDTNQRFLDALQHEDQLSRWIAEDHPDRLQDVEERIYAKVLHQIPELQIIPLYRRSWFRVAAVASVLLMVGLTYCLRFSNGPARNIEIVKERKANDVEAPKGTKATITLADGKTISVDSLTAIPQGAVQLSRTLDGKIVYSGNTDQIVYNTLTNPRGSKVIDMMMSDGSHVWLNAGSSISYPVSFRGSERKVTISGEAYFEVAHNASMPFQVAKGKTVVSVLGTHFNINAYDDEPAVKVSLLEGSVKVSGEQRESAIIRPGQQAIVTNIIEVKDNVDMEVVMSWKNGLFKFNKMDIKSMMRQAERWYDIKVTYPNGVPADIFTGEISREVNLSEFVKILQYSDVEAEISGKVLVVNPNQKTL